MRVLLIDDERRLVDALAKGLIGQGFAVDIARDGYAGYLAAVDEAFDVIVLDVMLPRLNGYEVCRRLRSEGIWTPILMLTAKDGEYDEAEALDLGVDDFLRKPFSYAVLVARLHALLRRSAPPRHATLRTGGGLTLDPGRREVRRGEVPIELTLREFALLEYLMHRAGEVVSKQSILEHVWGEADDRPPNLVEVYIGYLRRKIDRPFDVPLIETVRGHGYRLSVDG